MLRSTKPTEAITPKSDEEQNDKDDDQSNAEKSLKIEKPPCSLVRPRSKRHSRKKCLVSG